MAAAAVLASAAAFAQHDAPGASGGDAGKTQRGLEATTREGRVSPRLQNLGSYSRKVTTKDPMAQTYFNQGLILAYAFNHAEAVRSFREVARIDPDCAMAFWGEAYALGPNINAPMDEGAVTPAWAAIQNAIEKKAGATEIERALIDAMAKRYAPDPKADRAPLDRAYADAMRDLARRYPDDADVLAIAAESLMDTRPWYYWTNDGNPRPDTLDVLTFVERAIAISPSHPLALHLQIHALEASQEAERAVASAERLGSVVPGAGHLVHMPSHLFFRVGRYRDAIDANLKAVQVDEDYISQCRAEGIYPAAYYPHNIHFLWIAYAFEGQSGEALKAARTAASKPHGEMAHALQQFVVAPYHTLVRFARWDEILAEPRPADDLKFVGAAWRYARGMALVAQGRPDEADVELEALRATIADPEFPADLVLVNAPPSRLAEIAVRVLSGQIADARGDRERAIAEFSAAARLEDSLIYNEPPDWPFPTRHYLGAALLAAGRLVEAEAVYFEDLHRHPGNAWGLLGLTQALKGQGEARRRDLEEAESRLAKAWPRADVKLTSSKW
jgi:tetratricopeptide (TPR) repeat protein